MGVGRSLRKRGGREKGEQGNRFTHEKGQGHRNIGVDVARHRVPAPRSTTIEYTKSIVKKIMGMVRIS